MPTAAPAASTPTDSAANGPPRRAAQGWRRARLWGLLIALLAVAQTLLVLLALNYETTRAQDRTEAVASAAAAQACQNLTRGLQSLQALLWNEPAPAQWRSDANDILRARRELLRIERRDAAFAIEVAVQTPYLPTLFTPIARESLSLEAEFACSAARRLARVFAQLLRAAAWRPRARGHRPVSAGGSAQRQRRQHGGHDLAQRAARRRTRCRSDAQP